MTVISLPRLRRLHRRHGGRLPIVLLYVREPHPGEIVDQPQTEEEKAENARRLKEEYDLPFDVVVDTLDGQLHRRFDVKPNAAHLIDGGGHVAFRSLWAADPALSDAVERVMEGEPPGLAQSDNQLIPILEGIGMMRPVFREVGARAERDLWRVAPPMALAARLAEPFGFLPPRWRLPAALGTIGVVAGVAWQARRS